MTFEEWLAKQPEDVKQLVQERFTALENTVKAVREERDEFRGQVKKITDKLGDSSDVRKQLDAVTKKANFFADATSQNCLRPQAAYALAVTEGLFTDEGSPDWEKIKTSLPEVFKAQKPDGNTKAGAGTLNPPKTSDWNDAFRNATVRK
jgi:hypothetical protein